MIPLIAGLLSELASNGLGLIAGAIEAKGKEVVEKKLGVKIPDKGLSPELVQQLQIKQMEHEEFLINAQIKQAEMELEADSKAQVQVSERWKADMMSDSWLSKNIRPLSLAYLTVFVTFSSVLSKWLDMKPEWVELLKEGWLIVLSAYFVGRSVQHSVKLWKQKKEEK